MLLRAMLAVLSFTMLSGGVYIFNDLVDIRADRLHPFKKKRPLASGKLSIPVTVAVMIFLVIVSLVWMYTQSYFLFLTGLVYLVMQAMYTGYLKKIPIVDILVIATGYVLRVYGGAFAIEAHMDVWFLLTVVSAALFLAVGKRKSEQTLLRGSGITSGVRTTLKRYTEQLIDVYASMFATTTWLTYALFTFNQPRIVPSGRALTLMASLPRTLISEKLLMGTVPLVIYGVMRYLQLVYESNKGESPERILLSDKPLMITVGMWGILVVGILYYIN